MCVTARRRIAQGSAVATQQKSSWLPGQDSFVFAPGSPAIPRRNRPLACASVAPSASHSANAEFEDTSAPSSRPCPLLTPPPLDSPQTSTICTASLSAGLSPCGKRSPSAPRIVSTHYQIGRNNCRQPGTSIVANQHRSRAHCGGVKVCHRRILFS